MNVRLLDTRVSEAAVKRPPETPRRWGHRSDRTRTTGLVASVVAAAHLGRRDDVPNLAAYRIRDPHTTVQGLVADLTARLGEAMDAPAPAPYLAASDRDRPLSFDDVKRQGGDGPAAAPVRPARRVLRPNAGRIALGFLSAVDDLPPRTAGHRIAQVIDRPARPEVLLYPDHGAEQMAAHLAAIGIYVDLFPNIGGEHAVALALAPIAAMLDGGETL